MQGRLVKTPARNHFNMHQTVSQIESFQNRIETLDDSFITEIHDRTDAYQARAKKQFDAGNMTKALRSLNEAARVYSRLEPISESVAYSYRSIADIYYSPGSHCDHEQAFYFYKKALSIYTHLCHDLQNLTQIQISEIYDYAFKCYSRMSAIYYELGMAYDCSIGTPYDYEFCFWVKNMAMSPDKLYFAVEEKHLIYWVVIDRKPVKGSIDLISTPTPFTLDYLNFYKRDILRLTSKAKHTRIYDKIDAEFSKKMKEKAIAFNKEIISTFINIYGIYDLRVAYCCNEIGTLYRSIKQHEIANYFFDLASGIQHLNNIIIAVHPNAMEFIRMRFMQSTGPNWDASVILSFLKEHAIQDFRTENCCLNLGALYHFIEQEKIAECFFTFAAEIIPLEDSLNLQYLSNVKANEKKLTATQSKMVTEKKSEKSTNPSKIKSFVKKCINTALDSFNGEVKTNSTSLFNPNAFFSRNNPNTEGHFYNCSFINTHCATFTANTTSAQIISPTRTNILGFLKNPQTKDKLPVRETNSDLVCVRVDSRNS